MRGNVRRSGRLTAEQLEKLRKLKRDSGLSNTALAERFGVSSQTIGRVLNEGTVLHPVQIRTSRGRVRGKLNREVTLRAYEVYCHLYGEQPALVQGQCRGGFGTGELIAFLYARAFPKDEWRDRAEEAMDGMENL